MKKVLALTLILEFSVVVIAFFLIDKFDTVKTSYRHLGAFSGNFPLSEPTWSVDENWKGYIFKEGLRLFFHSHKNPIKNLEDIRFYNFKGDKLVIDYISLGDSAFIAFKPARKGYVVTSVIALDTLVLWIDMISRSSTLDNKFLYFVSFLKSLKYNDNYIARSEFSNTILAFRKRISPFLMQSKKTFFAFILGILLFANLLTFLALFGGGACPKIPESDWETITPGVMVYEKLPMGQKSYSACLVKRGNEILILVFRKVRKTLNIDEIRSDIKFRGKTLIVGNSLRIELPDEETLSRWQTIL
uniref:Uncharacterized protein n=1 Tax=candidate division WOR-3 bacterium TaxID=2052148 RepID=A0A7C2P2K2_UNCW3